MSEQPQTDWHSVAERLVAVAVDLAGLALMWRALDGPAPLELLDDAYRAARRRVDGWLGYRRAMAATLRQVRNLPEVDEEPES